VYKSTTWSIFTEKQILLDESKISKEACRRNLLYVVKQLSVFSIQHIRNSCHERAAPKRGDNHDQGSSAPHQKETVK
jgi:hypothetical protein